MKNPVVLFIVLVVFAVIAMSGLALYKKKKEAAQVPAPVEVIEPAPAK